MSVSTLEALVGFMPTLLAGDANVINSLITHYGVVAIVLGQCTDYGKVQSCPFIFLKHSFQFFS